MGGVLRRWLGSAGKGGSASPVRSAWELYGAIGSGPRDKLNSQQRGLLAVCDLRQEVSADGFEGYFSAWGGDTALDALEALPPLLGYRWAAVLREAMEALGDTYPSGPDERYVALQDVDDAELNDLFARFLALESTTDADRRLDEAAARLWP